MALEQQLAHCKIPTGTQSMCYNQGSQRLNSSTIMSYTDRKIKAIDIRTDVIRLIYNDTTGVDFDTPGANGTDWGNIFSNTVGLNIYPTSIVYAPNSFSDWDLVIPNTPKYKGDSHICAIVGTVVYKLSDGITNDCNLQLALFINDSIVSPKTGPGVFSNLQAMSIPDRSHANNKATSTLYVNVVTGIVADDTVQLKIRNNSGGTIQCHFYNVSLLCRPVELSGIDRNVAAV